MSAPRRWAVFFDRDGVLTEATVRNGEPASPRSEAEFVVLPGARDAVGAVQGLGALAVVVSNQPDVARGLLAADDLERMNERLRAELGVDHVAVCPHDGTEGCCCRKPRPGLLVESAALLGIDLPGSWMVGDRWVDVAAGDAAGASTVLLTRTYSWKATSSHSPPAGLGPTATCANLSEAVALIAWGSSPHEPSS